MTAPSAAAGSRKDWRVGLRFIFADKLLLPALTLDMFAVLFAGVTALLPAIADDVLHVGPFGYGVFARGRVGRWRVDGGARRPAGPAVGSGRAARC